MLLLCTGQPQRFQLPRPPQSHSFPRNVRRGTDRGSQRLSKSPHPGMSQGPFLGVDDKALQCQVSLHPVYHGQGSFQVPALSSSHSCVSVPSSNSRLFTSSSPILLEYSPLAFINTRIRQSSSSPWITLVALIDCGAQGNFISPSVIEKHLMDLQYGACERNHDRFYSLKAVF